MTTPLPSQCDTLIVGAGVVGLSLAYELARRGGEGVVVVDRQQPGLEASWAGAGILPPGSWYDDHPSLEALAALSRQLHGPWCDDLLEHTGIDSEYRVHGAVHLANDDAAAERLHAKFSDWRARGIAAEAIDRPTLANLEPQLVPGTPAAIFHTPSEGRIDNRQHVAALQQRCEQLGVAVIYPAEVTAVTHREGRIDKVETAAGVIVPNCVVLAAGAWSRALGELFGVRLAIRPMRGQMIAFDTSGSPPISANVHCGDRYLIPRSCGRVIVGSTVDDVGFDKQTVPEQIADLEAFARQLSPTLGALPIADQWAGLRPASADGLPYIGAMPDCDNGFVAAGHFRAGLQFAAATAIVLADLLTNRTPPLSIEAFRVDR